MKARFRTAAVSALFAFALAQNAPANLVQDGTFTGVTLKPGYAGPALTANLFGEFGTGTGTNLTVANWATTGYNFVYTPSTADSGTQATGANAGQPNQAPGQYNAPNGYGNTYMWGPQNGSANGLPANSPAGGNFLALDGDTTLRGAVTQTINGLTIGNTYALTFYWAAAQQESFTVPTTESFTVSLGPGSGTTSTISLVTKGFSGWRQQTFYYTANAASETLTFLANGTPNGQPPFLLLGGVDLEIVPEFSNWMVFAAFGVICIAFDAIRRRRRQSEFAPAAPAA